MSSSRIFKLLSLIPLAIFIAMLVACPYPDRSMNYPEGTIPETVTLLQGANSIYDDYNATAPLELSLNFPFYFSSNRATRGGTFDIESFALDVVFNQTHGDFSLYARPQSANTGLGVAYPTTWQSLNSDANEFGPYYLDNGANRKLFLFASDRNGKLDIYHALYDYRTGFSTPQLSAPLNSEANDAYPSVGPDGSIYFSSDRNGTYQIFRVPVTAGMDIISFLGSTGSPPITPVDAVNSNSNSNDKAPFIIGNLMVFASDRPGGFGGFDLWYSTYVAGVWSQPVNFGPNINSASDEFRPIVMIAKDFVNDLMIFSSNRPGGMGGFDLYYVGIPKR